MENVKWENARKVLEQYAERLIAQYRQNLTDDGSNASYELARTLSYRVAVGTSHFTVIISLQDYWKYLENGRRPYGAQVSDIAHAPRATKFPPLDAIAKWIQVKPVVPQVRNGKAPSVRSLAYLIARSIAVRGIKPRKGFQRAYEATIEGLRTALATAVATDITQAILSENRG